LQKGNEVRRWGESFPAAVAAVAFAPDGHLAVSGGSDTALRVWKLGK
jgi:hypothetical protein